MKILHINNYDKKGGAETVFNITRHNLTNFENFSGFVQTESDGEKPDIDFLTWEKRNKILGIFSYIFSYSNYKKLLEFLKSNQIDVIHIHGFFTSISPSILLAIRKIKHSNQIRVIQTLHDYHVICPNSSLYNYSKKILCEKCIGKKYKLHIFIDNCDRRGIIFSIIKGIRSFIAENILQHKELFDCFIAPSSFLKEKVLLDNIDSKKVRILRYPIVLPKKEIPQVKENIICFFGRFSEEKNIVFLIKAFSKWKEKSLNNFKLLLIGEGEKEYELKEIASKEHCSRDIFFEPFLPQNELVERIKTVKYSSITSKWYENFPMSIIESVILKIIPIAPDIGGMNEMINNFFKAGRTYESGVIDSWISTLEYLEINYQLEIKKLDEAIKNIFSFYNMDSYIKNITEVYHEIVKDG